MISEARADSGWDAADISAASQRSGFYWVLLGSSCAHLLLVLWVATQNLPPKPAIDASPGFDVRLVRTKAAPPVAASLPTEAPTESEPEPSTDSDLDPLRPSTASVSRLPPAQTAEPTSERLSTRPEALSTPDSPDQTATSSTGTLNLSRPMNWERLAIESPEALDSRVFKRSTGDAIAQRKAQQASAAALTRAQIERLGLAASEFRRRTDQGEEVKTAKGCFVKRLEHGPSGMQERWWRTACNDARKPAWRREVLSFGPDHRVESSTEGVESDCPEGHCWAY